jgi:hypothetical protein
MTFKFLLPLAAVSMLALAACDSSTPAPSSNAPTAAESAATAAPVNLDDTMKALQDAAAGMSPGDKAAAVSAARKASEDVARSQGLSDELIKQAGDTAESVTRKALGVE